MVHLVLSPDSFIVLHGDRQTTQKGTDMNEKSSNERRGRNK